MSDLLCNTPPKLLNVTVAAAPLLVTLPTNLCLVTNKGSTPEPKSVLVAVNGNLNTNPLLPVSNLTPAGFKVAVKFC